MSQTMLRALKKKSGDYSNKKSHTKCSKVDDMPPKIIAPSTKPSANCREELGYPCLRVNDQLARGEDMSVELLIGSLLKESTRLLDANKLVEDLRKEMNDMSSTGQLEEDNETLSKDVNSLKDERENLCILLSCLTEEKKVLQETLDSKRTDFGAEREVLQKEVENVETTSLEIFYEFWKANPEEEAEAANTNPPINQESDAPAADDTFDPYKEPRTPAL
uniref:Uncharacterized protein n=1 Tax=Cannabis sativa TaxID=3483 RepID=A0A803Q5S1_CANSA